MKKKTKASGGEGNARPFSDPEPLYRFLDEVKREELEKISRSEEEKLKTLQERTARERDDFYRREREESTALLSAEETRLARTFEIERRRIVSHVLEKEMERAIDAAGRKIAGEEAFLSRLRKAVDEEVAADTGVRKMYIAPGDLSVKDILPGGGIDIEHDSSIVYGGAIVEKDNGELVNLTLDRLLFRMRDTIRLEVIHLLKEEGVWEQLEGLHE